MKRDALLSKIAVFDEDGCHDVVVDDLKVTLSPVDLGARKHVPVLRYRDITDTRHLGLAHSASVQIERRPDGLVLQWEHDEVLVQQRVGPARRGDHSGASQTLDLNPLRLVRHAMGLAGARFPQPPTGADNFIDPRVRSGREVRAFEIELLFAILGQRVAEYRAAILPTLFGVAAGATDVRVSLNEVEICWDRSCPCLAEVAHHAYWPAWRRRPDTTLSASGCLKRQGLDGENVKLYPKTRDALRYEVQLSGNRVAAVLGRRVRFENKAAFADALLSLADHYYPAIREVQAELLDPGLGSLSDILGLWLPFAPSRAANEVVHDLLATGRTKCRSQAHYRVLRALRARGGVERSKAKGVWVSTPAFNATLGVLHRFLVATGSRWRAA